MSEKPENGLLTQGLRLMGLAALFVALGLLLWHGGRLLLLTFAGILLSAVLRVPMNLLKERMRMPDRLAYTVVLLALLALAAGFGMLVGPRLLEQSNELREQIPQAVEQVRGYLEQRGWGQWLIERLEGSDGGASGGAAARQGGLGSEGLGGDVTSRIGNAARTAWTTLAHLVYVLVAGLFLAANPTMYRRGLIRLFPAERQERAREVINEVGRTLRAWLMGQLVLMFITGALTGIGLTIIGVPLALALAVFVGLMEFIPLIGPIIGFIPIILIAFTEGSGTVLWATILYLVVQQIEGNLLTPLIQQRAVDLPPVLTLAAVFLGGALFGPLGVIIATPLMAVIFVLVKMLYLQGVLGQKVHVPGIDGRI